MEYMKNGGDVWRKDEFGTLMSLIDSGTLMSLVDSSMVQACIEQVNSFTRC
jgi:hypothetical protein